MKTRVRRPLTAATGTAALALAGVPPRSRLRLRRSRSRDRPELARTHVSLSAPGRWRSPAWHAGRWRHTATSTRATPWATSGGAGADVERSTSSDCNGHSFGLRWPGTASEMSTSPATRSTASPPVFSNIGLTVKDAALARGSALSPPQAASDRAPGVHDPPDWM